MEEPVIDNELLLDDENMADGGDEVSASVFNSHYFTIISTEFITITSTNIYISNLSSYKKVHIN